MTNNKIHSGFTLIEVVIALAVFAIVGTMAFSGLNVTLNQQVRLAERSDEIKELQLALKYLERDLNQVARRPIRDQFGDQQLAFTANADFLVSFTFSGWRNPAGLSRSNLQRISYEVRDEEFIRHSWNRLDGVILENARSTPLLDGIEEIEWLFLNEQNNWINQWPPINAQGSDVTLPLAVSVSLTIDSWGEITRVFPLPR